MALPSKLGLKCCCPSRTTLVQNLLLRTMISNIPSFMEVEPGSKLSIINKYKNFRLFLQSELLRRSKANSSYSLRAFAKSLDIHHSALSRILRGKRGISRAAFESMVEALDLNPQDVQGFKQSLAFDEEPTKQYFQDLTIDTFTVISEWYHDAILELMRTKNFKPDPKQISKSLGISLNEVNAAVERLVRLDLIEIVSKGKWIGHADHTEAGISDAYTTSALKKNQQQILKMAIVAIGEVPREKRHNISTTMAIDIQDMEKIKKLINEFRRKLAKFAQRDKVQADEVYQFGICFYPLTKGKSP